MISVPYRDRYEPTSQASAAPIRPMIPEVRNLESLTGNADSTMPVYAVRQALEELSSTPRGSRRPLLKHLSRHA